MSPSDALRFLRVLWTCSFTCVFPDSCQCSILGSRLESKIGVRDFEIALLRAAYHRRIEDLNPARSVAPVNNSVDQSCE